MLTGLTVLLSLVPWVDPPPALAANGFIERSERHLILDGTNFRFTGLNIYNANSDGSCGPVVDLDQALSDIGPGKAVIRAWFFQNMATTAGSRDWSRMDQTLATAAAHGVKVIPVLTNQWADCDGGYGFKTKTWYESGYADPDPSGTVSYRDWVAEIVDRYKDNPTVAFWQLINEAEVQDVEGGDCSLVADPAETLRTWAADVAGLVKAIDSNHLVSLGTIGGGQCGTQGAEYEYVHSLPEIDLCEYHDYGSPLDPLPGDEFNGFEVRVQQCITNLGKPLFVGESGIIPDDVGGLQERADAIAAKLAAQFGEGAVGFLAWAYLDPPSAGTFDVGSGDPTLGVLELQASVEGGLPAYVVPSPEGLFVDSTDVNESGLVVGGNWFVTGSTSPLPITKAFKWQAPVGGEPGDSGITYLPLPPTNTTPGWALSESVNNIGRVAGSYADDGDFGLFRFDPVPDASVNIGSLSPTEISNAHAINDPGMVVGVSGQQAFIWTEVAGIQPLAFDGDMAAATDINNSSLIVGYGRGTSTDPFHVLVWDGANPSELPLDLGTAGGTGIPRVSVNNLGEIVAPAGLWTPDGSGGYIFSTVGGTPIGIADNGVIPLGGFDGRLAHTGGTTETITLSDPAATAVSPEAISSNGRYLLVRVFTDAGSYDAVVDLGQSTASGFVVNDPGDDSDASPGDGTCKTASGACTLRAAIEETNALASPSPQLITFSISAPIRPTSPLPALSASAILDGTTSGCDGSTPTVELDGSLLGGLDDGLVITGGNTIVRGLLIHSFPGSGVEITGPGGNRIECSFIGTDGSNDLGNGFGVSVHGSPDNEIGGSEPNSGNLIAGNGGTGVTIRNPGADANKVQGNLIGTDSTGESSIPNGIGVFVTAGASGTLIGGDAPGDGNVISGNANQGVSVTSSSTVGTSILGNLIGTSATGSTALGNTFGVSIEAVDTWVGDGSEMGRNIISGQSQHGVTVAGTASGTYILGNHIGTDVTGTVPVPNRSGIWIAQTGDTFVGGDQPGEGNLISGNTLAGVQLVLGAHDNVIAGNRIGAGLNGETSGAAALGNGGYGVILDNATENAVGGMGAGEGNVIAQSSGPGVLIFGGSNNTVLGNSVTDNGGLGIDHGDDDVTLNSGPGITPSDNESDGVLNYPILTSVTTDGSVTEVSGELKDTIPSTTFHIEFFSNAVCDPSGFGEGATLIGIANSGTPVLTDAAGNGSFTVSLPLATTIGDAVTATVTGGGKGTSEFSSCVSVEPSEPADTTPPEFKNLPPDNPSGPEIVLAPTSAAGASTVIDFLAVDDSDGNVVADCTPPVGVVSPSGPISVDFPVGTTVITCTATDSAGNTITRTLEVTVTPWYGTLVIEQQTVPGGQSQTFGYSGAIVATLLDNQVSTLQVDPGSYSVSQGIVPGWTLEDITCSDPDSTGRVSEMSADFNIETGEEVRCVFTNSQDLEPTNLRIGSATGRSWWDRFTSGMGACETSGGRTLTFGLNSSKVPLEWGSGSFQFETSLTLSSLSPATWNPDADSLLEAVPSGTVTSLDTASFHVEAAEGYADVTFGSDIVSSAINRAECVQWLNDDLSKYFTSGVGQWEDTTGFRYAAAVTLSEYEAVIHPAVGLPVRERGFVRMNMTAQETTWPNGSGSLGGIFLQFVTTSVEILNLGGVGSDSVQGVLDAGETLGTDPESDGAVSPSDLIEVFVTTPNAGYVTIDEIPTSLATGNGFDLAVEGLGSIGWSVYITAPNASQADPLIIEFMIDSSIYPSGGDLVLLRNGSPVGPCPVAEGPCIEGITAVADDTVITVRTDEASWWDFGLPIPDAHAGGPYSAVEGDVIILDGTESTAPSASVVGYLWNAEAFIDDPASPTPLLDTSGIDDGVYPVDLQVSIGGGLSDSATAQLTVTNAPPTITEITGPSEPLAVGESANLEVRFDDPGILDTHTVTADFGDGQIGSGLVDQASRIASLAHVYDEPGVYRVDVTIADDDGGVDSQFYEFVVVYDPSGGFVTGGGWIESPPGAYVPAPELAGKASFGFVSKYKKGRTVPDGNTEFQFKAADFNFVSDAYDWLVVAGERAQFKGTGTVNGAGDYGFLLTAVDGQRLGPDRPDRFRIKIWDRASGMVIYDNQPGDADDAEIVTEIGGGAIVIHDGR